VNQDQNARQTIVERQETQWFDAEVRPLVAADDGMLIAGRTHSLWFVGRVAAGGELIVPLPGAAPGEPDIAASLVVVYALLDPPVRTR
jgi:hypothetical protein